tara:strand:- start:128 stop:334 length:207 start_codon:yes stop_codon:yes gene_type:complete
MSNIIENLSKNIEIFIHYLPEQIEDFQNIIKHYKNLSIENDKLKKENKSLKNKLKNYENIPTIFCEKL